MKESVKANPYGFLPLLIPALPYLIPAAVGAGAVWWLSSDEPKRASKIGSLISGPVLIGAGVGYAAGAAAKLDQNTRLALAAAGLGIGWTIQHYIIAPAAYEKEYEQQQEEEAAEYRWYKPWTW